MTEYTMLYADFTNASNGNLVNVVKAWVAKDGVDVPESIVPIQVILPLRLKKKKLQIINCLLLMSVLMEVKIL
ncbi:hypothetical protein [Bacteroides nordii]|uniref:hypothetical protein n=1 Tax=Bacteroides nordii TaxID=291645 RepID=UPI00242F1742|nr:hypothetical protein [Bacteroides nordii]